jgi:hypothetical protein
MMIVQLPLVLIIRLHRGWKEEVVFRCVALDAGRAAQALIYTHTLYIIIIHNIRPPSDISACGVP